MKTQDVIDHFGGVRQAAEALGVTTQAIYRWGDEVPAMRQPHIQIVTKGKLKMSKGKK
jgi:hypothetical protein